MKVVGGQQSTFTLLDPAKLRGPLAGGTVTIEAGVVKKDIGRALLAAVEVATEGGGAAAFEIAENP